MTAEAPGPGVVGPLSTERGRRGWRRPVRRVLAAALVLFAALQAVPYGWRHPNPSVTAEPPWPSERVRALATGSCGACHSNETDWPLYAYLAPMSWLVRRDVEDGRQELNFSTWGDRGDAGDAADAVADGSMPPGRYTLLHPGARLSDAERDELVAAFEAMDDLDDGGGGGGGHGGDEDVGRGRGRGRDRSGEG